jgi:hypothetical protein
MGGRAVAQLYSGYIFIYLGLSFLLYQTYYSQYLLHDLTESNPHLERRALPKRSATTEHLSVIEYCIRGICTQGQPGDSPADKPHFGTPLGRESTCLPLLTCDCPNDSMNRVFQRPYITNV